MDNNVTRPLSPHLGVYKLPLVALMSISHRLSGVYLFVMTLVMLWFAFGVALFPSFATYLDLVGDLPMAVMLYAWMFSLYYHMCNGVRHLVWDVGRGFSLASVKVSNLLVFLVAVILSIITLSMVYHEL